jgi:hypothetical protein
MGSVARAAIQNALASRYSEVRMSFPNSRFAYQIVTNRDHEAALKKINEQTSQGWRASQMCIDPRDGSLVVMLEMKFQVQGIMSEELRELHEAKAGD